MNGWKQDKRWSDRFIPEISGHLGQLLICEPPIVEDLERNSDLMVLGMDSVRIGCRIRKHQYQSAYGNQFTIRSSRPSGQKTELKKIIEGWGDYFFYGFSDESEEFLSRWFIGDLKVFRAWFVGRLARMDKGDIPGMPKKNKDNSSAFAAFNINDLPDSFIVKSSWVALSEGVA